MKVSLELKMIRNLLRDKTGRRCNIITPHGLTLYLMTHCMCSICYIQAETKAELSERDVTSLRKTLEKLEGI